MNGRMQRDTHWSAHYFVTLQQNLKKFVALYYVLITHYIYCAMFPRYEI